MAAYHEFDSDLRDLTLTSELINNSFAGEGLNNIEPPSFDDMSSSEDMLVSAISFNSKNVSITEDNSKTVKGTTEIPLLHKDRSMHSTPIINNKEKEKIEEDKGMFEGYFNIKTTNPEDKMSKDDVERNKYKLISESLECIFFTRSHLRKSYTSSQKKKYRDDFNESTFKDLGLSIATTKGCTSDSFLHILKCCFELISPQDTRSKLVHLWPIKDKKNISPLRKIFFEMMKDIVKTNGEYFKGVKPEHLPAVLQVPNGERFTRFLTGLLNYTLDKYIERKRKLEKHQSVGFVHQFKDTNDIQMLQLQIESLENNTKSLEKETIQERIECMKQNHNLEVFNEHDLSLVNYSSFGDDTLTETQDSEDNINRDAIEERVEAYLTTQKVYDFEFGLSDDLIDQGLEDEIIDKRFQIGVILKEIDESLSLFSNLIKKINMRNMRPVKQFSIDASKILDDYSEETREGVKYNFNKIINLRIEEIENILKLQAGQPPPQSLVKNLLDLERRLARFKKLADETNFEAQIKQCEAQLKLYNEEAKGIDWTSLTETTDIVSGWSKCLKLIKKY